jgi:type IV secretory pathway TrbD component
MKAPIRKSLLRQISWFGGDRRLIGFGALLLFLVGWTLFVAFGMFYGLPIILPFVIFSVILWVAREANKADPMMVDVMLRQLKYRKFYAAKPDIGIEHPIVRDFTS